MQKLFCKKVSALQKTSKSILYNLSLSGRGEDCFLVEKPCKGLKCTPNFGCGVHFIKVFCGVLKKFSISLASLREAWCEKGEA